MTKRSSGKAVSSAGIRKIQTAVTKTVRTSTTTIDHSETVSTATPMARRSTSKTNGQIRNETTDIFNIGASTSSSASGGKICGSKLGGAPARTRRRTIGKTEC